MTERINPTYFPIQWGAYVKPMLIGAAIGLVAISVFVFGVNQPNPAWPAYWQVRPLLLTPVVTAMGGAGVAFLAPMRSRGGWMAALGFAMSIIGFVFALWIGLILGLNGTMWN